MKALGIIILVTLVVAAIVASQALFVVDQTGPRSGGELEARVAALEADLAALESHTHDEDGGVQ